MAEVEPSGSRQEIVNKFKEICAVNDEIARAALAERNWNLEAAVRLFLDGEDHADQFAGDSDSDGDNIPMRNAPINQQNPIDHNVTNRAVTAAPQNWGFVDWLTNAALTPIKIIVWSLRLVLDYFYSMFGGPPLPLADPRDEVRNFVTEFRQKYDQNALLPWLEMSYNSATNESRRAIRYLLVYVHNPSHPSVDEFARNYLLSQEFLAFIQQENCLIWGASIRSSEGHKICTALRDFNYPFVALLCQDEGRTSCVFRMSGDFTLRTLMDGLQNSCQSQRFRLDRLLQERQQREMNNQLRREQEADYERALAADRARVQEKKRLESEQLESQKREDELRRQAEQKLADLHNRRREIRASLPSEPVSGDIVRVSVRFPNGSKLERRFNVDDSLELLFNVVFADANCPNDFSLISSYPRKELKSAPTWYKSFSTSDVFADVVSTFREAGLENSLAILVRDNEA